MLRRGHVIAPSKQHVCVLPVLPPLRGLPVPDVPDQAAEPRIQPPLSYTLPGPVPYTLLVPPPPSSGAVLYLALSIMLGYLNNSSSSSGATATAAATAAWAAAMGASPDLAAHRTVRGRPPACAHVHLQFVQLCACACAVQL